MNCNLNWSRVGLKELAQIAVTELKQVLGRHAIELNIAEDAVARVDAKRITEVLVRTTRKCGEVFATRIHDSRDVGIA